MSSYHIQNCVKFCIGYVCRLMFYVGLKVEGDKCVHAYTRPHLHLLLHVHVLL